MIESKIRTHIRWLVCNDLKEVSQIERLCYGPNSWSAENFLACLRQRNAIGMIVENDESREILGFMVYELQSTKLHLLNFAVHPAWQRRGIGRRMVAKLPSKMFAHRRSRLTAHVPERNLQAQLFFRDPEGFTASGIVRGDAVDGSDSYQFVLTPKQWV